MLVDPLRTTSTKASIKMFAEEVVELLEMLLQVLIIPPMHLG